MQFQNTNYPERYYSHFGEKHSLQGTAEALHVSRRTVITWCRNYPEFKQSQILKSLIRLAPIYEKQANRRKTEFGMIRKEYV